MKVLCPAITALLSLVVANNAFAQTAPAATRVRLEVVLSQFEGETKTGSLPFLFSLFLNQKGSLRVDADPAKNPPLACASAIVPPTQFVGTQVESTVIGAPDARFHVNLVLTERARAGCRDVQGSSIPVFSNKVLEDNVSLRNGESAEIVFRGDPQRNESIRLRVTLTTQD